MALSSVICDALVSDLLSTLAVVAPEYRREVWNAVSVALGPTGPLPAAWTERNAKPRAERVKQAAAPKAPKAEGRRTRTPAAEVEAHRGAVLASLRSTPAHMFGLDDIATATRLPKPAVSLALRTLVRSKLVEQEGTKRTARYTAAAVQADAQ